MWSGISECPKIYSEGLGDQNNLLTGEGGGHEEGQPARLESEMLSLGAAVSSEESATRHVVCAVWVRLPL